MPTPAHFENFSGIVDHLLVMEVRNDWKQGMRLHYGGLTRNPRDEKQVFEVSYNGVLRAPDVKSLSAARAQLRRPSREPLLLPRIDRNEDGINVQTFFPSRVPDSIRGLKSVGSFRPDLSNYFTSDHKATVYLLPSGTAVYLQEGVESFDEAEEFIACQRGGGVKDPFLYSQKSSDPGRLWWFRIPKPAHVPSIPVLPLAYLEELERVEEEWAEEQRRRQAEQEAGKLDGEPALV